MSESDISTEQDLMESIQQGLAQDFAGERASMTKSKGDSLKEMKKALPEWSLEPPETFLA
ncbi:MAG: hypothetical protein IJ087_21020 [Eggerthellaceae bacterium]|nr:hypothetical protein [Eggerthellaceae bacterium]